MLHRPTYEQRSLSPDVFEEKKTHRDPEYVWDSIWERSSTDREFETGCVTSRWTSNRAVSDGSMWWSTVFDRSSDRHRWRQSSFRGDPPAGTRMDRSIEFLVNRLNLRWSSGDKNPSLVNTSESRAVDWERSGEWPVFEQKQDRNRHQWPWPGRKSRLWSNWLTKTSSLSVARIRCSFRLHTSRSPVSSLFVKHSLSLSTCNPINYSSPLDQSEQSSRLQFFLLRGFEFHRRLSTKCDFSSSTDFFLDQKKTREFFRITNALKTPEEEEFVHVIRRSARPIRCVFVLQVKSTHEKRRRLLRHVLFRVKARFVFS